MMSRALRLRSSLAPPSPRLTRYSLRWSPTPRLRRLTLLAVLAVVAALTSGRGELAALAAAPVVLLVLHPRSALPPSARLGATLSSDRAVEEDELELVLDIDAPGADHLAVTVPGATGVDVDPAADSADPADPAERLRWTVIPHRWGRHQLGPLRVRLVAAAGLYATTVLVDVPALTVYPQGGVVSRPVAPRQLPARLGEHASRAVGSGVEFGGVRPFAAGDRRRDVDWRMSARHRELYVRQYAAERSFAITLVLDAGTDAGEPGRSTLDLTVRAATALAQSYLRVHDRVGVVTLAGFTRWLTPDASIRQLHRLAELVMDVRADDTSVAAGLSRVPRSVFEPGTFVCLLSPMLDTRALEAVQELHGRGLGLLVVDVLSVEPDVGRVGTSAWTTALALRVWRLEREAVRVELARLGVPVLRFDGTGDLSGALLHAMRAVPPGVRA